MAIPAFDVSCNDNGVVISFDMSKVPLVAKLEEVIAQGVLKLNCCISVEFIIYTLVPSELIAKSITPTGQVYVLVDDAVLISPDDDSVYCSIVPAALFKTYISVSVEDNTTDVTPAPGLNVAFVCIFPKLASESNVKELNIESLMVIINVSVSLT